MPLYEYRCNPCRRRFSLLARSLASFEARCPYCGSPDLARLISPFAVLHSEEGRLEEMSDVSKLGDLGDDPRARARWMRRMGEELGEDAGPELSEMVERMEAGEMPEEEDAAEDRED